MSLAEVLSKLFFGHDGGLGARGFDIVASVDGGRTLKSPIIIKFVHVVSYRAFDIMSTVEAQPKT